MATTKIRKARAKKEVKHALRKLDPKDVEVILASERAIAQEKIADVSPRTPGQTVDGIKIAWTRRDITERFPTVELLSEENIVITWNGVPYQLLQGATHYVPSVIRDSYLRHRSEMRKAGKSLGEGSGFTPLINLGAGGLEPE